MQAIYFDVIVVSGIAIIRVAAIPVYLANAAHHLSLSYFEWYAHTDTVFPYRNKNTQRIDVITSPSHVN